MFSKSEFQILYDDFLETVKQGDDSKRKSLCKAECNRFSEIAKKYLSGFSDIYTDLLSKTVRKEYSSGGELLVRGFYCPSPIQDIVTGNCKRGMLYKKLTSRSKPSYEYCFDEKDRLILVNHLYSDSSEILEYGENTVLGITFSKNDNYEIIRVVECKYDCYERIISFSVAHSCHNDCLMDELEIELYAYKNEGLDEAEVVHYLACEQSETLNYEKYKFKHDEEGFLTEYSAEPSVFDIVYKVNLKRRI